VTELADGRKVVVGQIFSEAFDQEWEDALDDDWFFRLDEDLAEDLRRPLDSGRRDGALHLASTAIARLALVLPDRADQLRQITLKYVL
jgi:hypothetical protein